MAFLFFCNITKIIFENPVQPLLQIKTGEINFIPHSQFIPDWIIILLIVILILLAFIRTISGKYMWSLFQSAFNNQTASRMYRERTSSRNLTIVLLEALYYSVLALYLYQVSIHFQKEIVPQGLNLYLITCALIIIFINAKKILYSLSGYLFRCNEEISEYLFYKTSGNHITGLFLLIPAFWLFFSTGLLFNILLITGLIIIITPSVINTFRGVLIVLKKDFSISYLILYLCTLEILPLFIVWKILW
ncbi:MAG: DUF4271 domain-containing protein [Prolixibacteraceae bacterium]|nr:DUF4271 domain-containing protein [Prolixibacteraceae bacterium]